MQWRLRFFLFCFIVQISLYFEVSQLVAKQAASTTDIYARNNLVAWCIVPFDARHRTPAERAKLLSKLGIKKFAYDYRAEHVASFEEEILALKAANIEITAWWFPTTLNDEARLILDLLKKHQIHTQLWVMGGGEPADSSVANLQKHLESESARIESIAKEAAKIGCTVGLYNHGGWFGEPENQIAIIERLKLDNVGIVYNLHHGHGHLSRFENMLARIQPHLYCLNLNGMVHGGDATNRKIMPLGCGDLDLCLLKLIRDSGYKGPIGLLNHTDLDAELRLQDNLAGLEWLVDQMNGKASAPPTMTTWSEGISEQAHSLLLLNETERKTVQELLTAARESGSSTRGLSVFASLKTSCFSCHKISSHGGTVGPELTGLSKQRSPEDIVASLYWPNKSVAENYRATVVQLADGTTIRGYKTKVDETSMTLRDLTQGIETKYSLADIEEERRGMSMMPEELMNGLSRQQQIDLIRLLLDVGVDPKMDLSSVDAVLEHSVAHTPQKFPFVRDPLEPERWPNWQHFINRDRIYDFYRKQAEYFRSHPHGPLIAPFPDLDGGSYGHWGNQNEDTWRGGEWNSTVLGSLQCGVFSGDGVTVTRGVCVRIGENGDYATCFNPDRLNYELVWKGFLKFSDVRHGFLGGIIQSGETVERPKFETTGDTCVYHGFYRHGSRVIFAYRIDDVEYLDSPWFENGKFTRTIAPRDKHPLAKLTSGGPPQWPDSMETSIRLGVDKPYAVDTIELPRDNPWKANFFGGGLGFLPNGSALLSTMPGDIWLVDGFSADAKSANAMPTRATWRRFAAGLHQPLGLLVANDGIFVMCRDQLLRLHDLNHDGEADFYECYSKGHETSASGHDFVCGLERDAKGNFYTSSGNQGLVRFSSDGKIATVLATGFRNPDGIGIYPDGIVTVPCSEGEWTPASMICAIQTTGFESSNQSKPKFFGYRGPKDGATPELPMLYLPRGMDNSSGGQVFVSSEKWGPLRNQLIHFSYGMGTHFAVLRDEVDGQLQAAAIPLPGEFLSGAHRGRFHPNDGQLYVCGMGGWGNYSPDLGCFQRIRFTGDALQMPIGFHVHENGVAVMFSRPLDPKLAADPQRHFAQAWNYRYSGAYGSPEYSTLHFGNSGHDVLDITGVHLLDGGTTLFVELPELQPVNQLHLRLNVDSGPGHDLFATVHKLDRPRSDLPNYKHVAKRIASHPMQIDLALATRRVSNPWLDPIPNARPVDIAAGKNLTYSVSSFRAKAGEPLALTFSNPDAVPHNWALLQPNSLERVGDLSNKLVADPEAFINQYIPKSDDVICYTDIVEPKHSFTIYFNAPQAKGHYPFLCTFPGHWMVMNGEMIVE